MTPVIVGNLTVRLAENLDERMEAYELMKAVFTEDNDTPVDSEQLRTDVESYKVADILITIDNITKKIVATYRIITKEIAEKLGSFYTELEYDITNIKKSGKTLMEFSRACTHKDYRNNITMMTTWRGLSSYIQSKQIKLMFGVPSFHGTNLDEFKPALSYLLKNHKAPDDIIGYSLQKNDLSWVNDYNLTTQEAFDFIPPLLKSYIRMGSFVGDGIFVDEDFNTTDVLLIVDFDRINPTYVEFFSRGLNVKSN